MYMFVRYMLSGNKPNQIKYHVLELYVSRAGICIFRYWDNVEYQDEHGQLTDYDMCE